MFVVSQFLLGGAIMAKCDICGKGAHFGNNVSHSHRRSNRIWNANIRNVKCKSKVQQRLCMFAHLV